MKKQIQLTLIVAIAFTFNYSFSQAADIDKRCPFNFNELKKDTCLNSTYNGMSVTIDMLDDNPDKIRIFTLRSFGESFYHSITDACLEFGYKGI